MGIDHVVLGVQVVADRLLRLRRLHRRDVGVDRFLPVADAGVDVRRHVLGVRRGRRDLGVAVGGVEPLLRGRRVVVEVDQVMRDARMLRQPLGDRLQDCGALGLLGVGLVVQVGRGVERDGIGDLRLVVVRIFRRDLLLRVAERAHALGMAELVVIGIHQQRARRYSPARARSWRPSPWPSGWRRGRGRDWAAGSRCADCPSASARCPTGPWRRSGRPSAASSKTSFALRYQ